MKMIVIGASAGGREPLRAVLCGLPRDLDAAVLVVRHTLPDSPPALAGMLQPGCALPVRTAVDGEPVEAGRVYVAPPGQHATMERGHERDHECGRGLHGARAALRDGAGARFALRPVAPGERETPSIDLSIVSAAQQFGEGCIAVILSGHLDDGTEGAQTLARWGGTTIVQSPASAEVASMPLNVLHRDSPEFVLEDRDIAGVLTDLAGETEPAWLSEVFRRQAAQRRGAAAG